MALVVILEPCRQLGKYGLSIRTIVNVHVIPLEGFDERFGHSVGLRTAHWCEARHQAQSYGKLYRLMGTIAATVVREPLNGMRKARSKAPLNALEHQVADHLTADAAGTRTPGHHFAVAGIQREGHPHHLAIPAGDFKAVRGPAQVRPDRDDFAVMSSSRRFAGITLQKHAVLRHQAVDALMVESREACFKPFAVHQRRNPAVAVSRPLIDQRAERGQQINVANLAVRRSWLTCAPQPLRKLRSGYIQSLGHALHGKSSSGNDGNREISFFSCASFTASRKISFSNVFLPRTRCNSRTCFCNDRISAFDTTSSSARIASFPPSLMRRLQPKIRLGAIP